MSDIFLNYALKDVQTASQLAAFFERHGLTVWWLMYVTPPGEDVATYRVKELNSAKVIITLWSHAARESVPVYEMLSYEGKTVTISVMLERDEIPFTFAPGDFDLSDWDGTASHAELQDLLHHVRDLIKTSSPTAAPPASLEELSLSEIQENTRLGTKESTEARPKDDGRFSGVFISYRRGEAAAYARGLYDRLAKHFGRERVFLDLENVGWGEDFVEAITSAAESCAVMIALISPRWSRGAGVQSELDDYVRLEVAKALGRKIRVIPILIQGASMPAPKELPEDLSPLVRRNALALNDTRWERDVEDLIKTLEKLLNG